MIISGIISIFLSGLYLGSKISYRLLSFLDHGTVRAILRNVISSRDCLLYPLDNVSNVPSGTNIARIHCITVYAGELPQFLIKISSTSSRSSLCVGDPTSILNLTPSSGHPEGCIIKEELYETLKHWIVGSTFVAPFASSPLWATSELCVVKWNSISSSRELGALFRQ